METLTVTGPVYAAEGVSGTTLSHDSLVAVFDGFAVSYLPNADSEPRNADVITRIPAYRADEVRAIVEAEQRCGLQTFTFPRINGYLGYKESVTDTDNLYWLHSNTTYAVDGTVLMLLDEEATSLTSDESSTITLQALNGDVRTTSPEALLELVADGAVDRITPLDKRARLDSTGEPDPWFQR